MIYYLVLLTMVGNLLFRSSLFAICSFAQIAHIIEQLYGICSRCSFKKSGNVQITLIALNQRATVSDSLRSLCKKERQK